MNSMDFDDDAIELLDWESEEPLLMEASHLFCPPYSANTTSTN